MNAAPPRDFRLRLGSSILALVAIGLLLSLLPRTSFVARSAGEIVDAVGPMWPEQSVEQVLDQDIGVVSEIRIWGAAGVGRGEAPVVAALLQGPDRELVRQDRVGIKASHLLQPYVLEFPPYHPAPGEALILQLWVTDERRNHAIFGTTEAGGDGGGPTLNLNATEQGPLAYEVIWRGDGWRAALEGSGLDRLRLAGGIAAAVLAILLRPRVVRRLDHVLRRAHAAVIVVRRPIAGKPRLARTWLAAEDPPGKPASKRRAIYVFPWLIPAFAILHFLANNLIILRAYEAIVPSAFIMACVTVLFIALRVILKGAAAAAVFTGLLGIVFFSYGHIYIADWAQPDRRILLGLGVPIILGIAMLLKGRTGFPYRVISALNFASIVMVAFPIVQLGLAIFATTFQQDRVRDILTNPVMLDERLGEMAAATSPDDLRDIYYIILDSYPRSGSPESFDNSEFIRELEDRGFYVDPNARSNYWCSIWSIASSLNMSYINGDEPCSESTVERHWIFGAAFDHALGHILTTLGYRYVHVSSGYTMTTTSRNADVVVDFTPNGRTVSEYTERSPESQYHYVPERLLSLSNRFMIEFAKTTLIKSVGRLSAFESEGLRAYSWGHPNRALGWLDYMKIVGATDSPKFVFAHLVSPPHEPYSFDRHGEILMGGWSDDHDPSVESAFYGQIRWLNGQILDTIDSILGEYDDPPIIVIMGDHAPWTYRGSPMVYDILAAYLLPGDGDGVVYSGMTSVNVFRLILRNYFGLDLVRLEDRSL